MKRPSVSDSKSIWNYVQYLQRFPVSKTNDWERIFWKHCTYCKLQFLEIAKNTFHNPLNQCEGQKVYLFIPKSASTLDLSASGNNFMMMILLLMRIDFKVVYYTLNIRTHLKLKFLILHFTLQLEPFRRSPLIQSLAAQYSDP